jgi:hypothetical protein
MTFKLNRIPNVEVINIWGNEDTYLEEISALIKVNDKHEIELNYISKDVFDYPNNVYISQLNGCHFYPYKASEPWYKLNIGTQSDIAKLLGLTFHTPKDVIQNIDSIYNFVKILKVYPEINYFCDTVAKTEMYLQILDERTIGIDSIYSFENYFNRSKFAKNLDWKY